MSELSIACKNNGLGDLFLSGMKIIKWAFKTFILEIIYKFYLAAYPQRGIKHLLSNNTRQ